LAPVDWTADALSDAMNPFYDDHELIRLDAEGRNGRHTFVEVLEEGGVWRVCQVLADPEGHNDWQCVFRVALSRAREEGRPVLELEKLGPIGSERGAFS